MTLDRPIRVGSRGSPLALIQDEEALSQLRSHHQGLEFEVVVVRTSGDANQTAPLAGMGLGVFVSQIEERLLSGDLDMAIHSLKDLPTRLPDGLTLGAILQRRDPARRTGEPLELSNVRSAPGRPHRHQQPPPGGTAASLRSRGRCRTDTRQCGNPAAQDRWR